jgi:hypothetical protein
MKTQAWRARVADAIAAAAARHLAGDFRAAAATGTGTTDP